jgi:hypothetical protein
LIPLPPLELLLCGIEGTSPLTQRTEKFILGGGGTGGTETTYAFAVAGAKRDIGKETREENWNVDPMPKLSLNTARNIRQLMRSAKEHIVDGNSFIGYNSDATTINTSALAYPFIPRNPIGSGMSFSVGGGGGGGSKGGD